jgi:MFS family permease
VFSLLVAPVVGRVGERHGSKPRFLAGCVATALGLVGLAVAHDAVGLVISGAA